MDDNNDIPAVVPNPNDNPNPAPAPVETPKEDDKPDYRPKLSDEEQLAILEGRAQRLRTKLGKKDEPVKQASTPDDLVQKTFLRSAGIADADEVDLALSTASKWNMSIDRLVDDADWQDKLTKFRTQRANERATSELKGAPGSKGATQTPEFYIARGTPPTIDEVPDRKTRAEITRAMMANAKNGKKFYNE